MLGICVHSKIAKKKQKISYFHRMKFKHVIVPCLLAWAFIGMGALFKIQSWQGAGLLITLGYGLFFLALVLLVIKLISFKDTDSFLNK